MTVGELIAELQQFPLGMPVVVADSEHGWRQPKVKTDVHYDGSGIALVVIER